MKRRKRLENIVEKIEDIEYFVEQKNGKIVAALHDRILRPAIRMQIVAIAEQFQRLKDENEFKLLENFSNEELRGLAAVRNYIAHDYDSVDDHILELVIRIHLPKIKEKVQRILAELSN